MKKIDEYNQIKNMIAFQKCKFFFDQISNFKYALVKGEALSIQIYHRTGMRDYSDIDILVSKDDISAIENILSNCGFVCMTDSRARKVMMLLTSHQAIPWALLSRDGTIICEIDINFSVFWGENHYEDKELLDLFLTQNIDTLDIFGVKVKALSLEHAFIQMCLHHYRDMNSIFLLAEKGIPSRHLVEVHEFVNNNFEIDEMKNIFDICEKYHIKKYVFYMLFYSAQLYKSDKEVMFLHMLKDREGKQVIGKYGLSKKEIHKWEKPLLDYVGKGPLINEMRRKLTKTDLMKINMNKSLMGVSYYGDDETTDSDRP